jgi:pyruvate formate lyase activating enzyme
MQIDGLQKMTLLDYPGKVACTVFLPGCNFSCPFCHNSQLLGKDAETVMDDTALLAFLEKRKGLLDGVCITGGEPTLQPGLIPLLQKIKAMGYCVKLDTNGYRPDILREAVESGCVDYVAMDIKNSPSAYPATAGLARFDLSAIEKSITYLASGAVAHEFRTTVVEPLHTRESIREMADWILHLVPQRVEKLFLQPFADRDSVPFSNLSAPNADVLAQYLEIGKLCARDVAIRG